MNITIVCFCYKGDENILEYSLKAANTVFGNKIKIALVDDSLKPISKDILSKLKNELSCEFVYEKSTFNRNINLNGKDCIHGIVDSFIKHSKNRDGIVIKLDPDTMIMRRTVFDEFAKNDKFDYASCYRPGCQFCGMCYMIKTSILEKCKKCLYKFDLPEDKGPEDYIIGLAACICSIPKMSQLMTIWRSGLTVHTEGVAWDYANDITDKAMKLYYDTAEFATFGNWFLYKGLTSDDRIKPMEKMLDFLTNQNKSNFTYSVRTF